METILAILGDNSPAIVAALVILVWIHKLIAKSNRETRQEMRQEVQAMGTALIAEMNRREDRLIDEMNRRDERINKRIDRVETRLESVSNDVAELKAAVAQLIATVNILKDWHPANPKNRETTAESPPPYNQQD